MNTPTEQQKKIDQYKIGYFQARQNYIKTGDACFILSKDDQMQFGFVPDNETDMWERYNGRKDVIYKMRDGFDFTQDGWRIIGEGRFLELVEYADGYTPVGIVAYTLYDTKKSKRKLSGYKLTVDV